MQQRVVFAADRIMSVALALVAILIELCFGYPERLLRAIGHPVMWIGNLIVLDRARLNRETADRKRGAARASSRLLVLLAVVGSIAFVPATCAFALPVRGSGCGLVAGTLIAQRSLHRHVAEVATALESGGVTSGRAAVAHIVGRDTAGLDAAGIARAAIESLGGEFLRGVVAPVLWMVIGGLPGAALYKAINTADSMIGHRTPRHAAFGWAAARLDDIVNLPASRLSALLLVAGRGSARGRFGAAAHGAPCGAMRADTVRPMPAVRRRRWRARSGLRLPVRASMAACGSTMP